jgi:hypothetical protein
MPRSQAVVLEVAVALAFGCAGLGLLRSARRRVKLHAEERALERRFPDQPWLWRPEWAGGNIPADRITPHAIAFDRVCGAAESPHHAGCVPRVCKF